MQGITSADLSRAWRVSPPYIVKAEARGLVRRFPDGSIDLEGSTALRNKYARVGRGGENWRRRHPAIEPSTGALTCSACGAKYRREASFNTATPHPDRFCSSDCEADSLDGMTKKRIQARRLRGAINDHAARPTYRTTYTPPPVVRDLHECIACHGIFDALATFDHDTSDVRFCDCDCEKDYKAGLDVASVQQRIRVRSAAGGAELEEFQTDHYLDYVAVDLADDYRRRR